MVEIAKKLFLFFTAQPADLFHPFCLRYRSQFLKSH
jgi:hypothetical protein